MAFILRKQDPEEKRLTILNVAGRGAALTYAQCLEIAKAKLVRVPTKKMFDLVLRVLWKRRISTIPPDVSPYMTSDTIMDTARLEHFLGPAYKDVIRYSISDAFAQCFKEEAKSSAA